MKSQKGITLTSLAIYILLVLVVLGILATITANFQGNIKSISEEGTENVEIDKFNLYFLKEVKNVGNSILSISSSEIIFGTNNKYTFKDNSIYLNDSIKIAENIIKCEFSQNLIDGKTVIIVNIKAKKAEEKSIQYVLNNSDNTYVYEDEDSYIYINSKQSENIENNETNTI